MATTAVMTREVVGIQLWSTRQRLPSIEELVSSSQRGSSAAAKTTPERTPAARIFSLFDRIKTVSHDHLCDYYDLIPCLQSLCPPHTPVTLSHSLDL